MPIRFTDKAFSTTLNDLAGSIQPALDDEDALTVLTMLNRFLAHAQVRTDTAKCMTIQEELLALSQEEKEEDAIIAGVNAGLKSVQNKDELSKYLRAELNLKGLEVTEIDASLGGYSKQTLLVSI